MQDNMERNNINVIVIPEREEEEQGIENLFAKVMMENFPIWGEKVTQIQETQRVPRKRNPKNPTARHIIIEMAKFQDKERTLKAAREKQEVTYKGAPIRLATDFSKETLQDRREWQNIFQVMRNKRPATKATLPSKTLNQDSRPNKELPRQKKSKRIHPVSYTHLRAHET